MRAQADQQVAKVADLSEQIQQKAAEAAEVAAESDKTNASLPMLAEKERIHRELTAQGYGTSLSFLDAQQQLTESRHQLGVLRQQAAQASAARGALERQREETQSAYASDILSDLRKAEEQQNELSQELIKAQNKSAQTELRSPIDGVVEQLALHTLHGVVTPAEHLMIIVPERQSLTIEAQIADQDVGFVHAGQTVKIKVETFNFTRYGFLNGRVLSVSKDVVAPHGAPTSPMTETGEGGRPDVPGYVARIGLETASMMIDGRREPLQPGMSVTAEIKIGSRTIIDYLFSPISRRVQESLHER
jgi:hemolysin D